MRWHACHAHTCQPSFLITSLDHGPADHQISFPAHITRLTSIGLAIGLAFGYFTGWLMRLLRWRGIPVPLDATVILAIAYLSFYVGQGPAQVGCMLMMAPGFGAVWCLSQNDAEPCTKQSCCQSSALFSCWRVRWLRMPICQNLCQLASHAQTTADTTALHVQDVLTTGALISFAPTHPPLQSSGVIAVAVFGLWGAATSLWGRFALEEEEKVWFAVWDSVSAVANGVVFFWAGVASLNFLVR